MEDNKLSLRVNVTAVRSDARKVSIREIPLTVQWIDVAEDVRPCDPREEYIRAREPLTKETMLWRWRGLGYDALIEEMYGESMQVRVQGWREAFHIDTLIGEQLPDITNPDIRSRINNRTWHRLFSLWGSQMERLEQGVEPDVESVYNPGTGMVESFEIQRPMKAREHQARVQAQRMLFDQMRLITGDTTEIVGKRDMDLSDERLAAAGDRLKRFRVQMTSGDDAKALPEGGTVEGVVVPEAAFPVPEARSSP